MLGKGLTVNQLHDQELLAIHIFECVDLSNVGMVEGSQELGLPLEASKPLGVGGERLGQDFDGDFTVERRILSSIHLSHTALTELLNDLVVAYGLANHFALQLSWNSVRQRFYLVSSVPGAQVAITSPAMFDSSHNKT